tara:strand:- start:197 stop:685 length:489 start_codon:yes stop_codon:yes gene_type:complete
VSNSIDRQTFDAWLAKNYSKLCAYAKRLHRQNIDLVHHTYLRIITLKGVDLGKVMINPLPYFKRAMFMEATHDKGGGFKKHYEIYETYEKDVPYSFDLSEALRAENFQLAVDRLSWFDGTVMMLYCDGYNLTKVAKEAGIKEHILHMSLSRSRSKLIKHFNK